MTYHEDENGNLVRGDGTVIPAETRTKCEIYSRVVGYLRPVENWNAGAAAQFEDRKTYKVQQTIQREIVHLRKRGGK